MSGVYFDSLTLDLIAILVIILITLNLYIKLFIYSYWKQRGIEFIPPSLPFGNFALTIFQRQSIDEFIETMYNKSAARLVGVFCITKPLLIVRDPQLIRSIVIKDFNHFTDRGIYIDEVNDPLSAHLLSITGDKWRNLRVKLTPVFTAGKLKAMFPSLHVCGEKLQKYMDVIVKRDETVEMREMFGRFTTDIFASVAFGLDIDSIHNPDIPFRKYGRQIFKYSFKNGIRQTLLFVPKLQRILGIKVVDDEVEKFIISVLRQTLEHREQINVVRKDLFQLLIQLRNMGNVQEDGNWERTISKDEGGGKNLTFNEIAAQVLIFYIAGFETSTSTLSFLMYEIVKNPEIQQKLQQEIDEITAQHNGQISYESLSEMNYLECCMDEVLRLHSVLPFLTRECTKEYLVPDSKIIIEKGTAIILPILGLQRDPKYYPNPNEFLPERFSKENKVHSDFHKKPYMPFGEGPRNCIGLRLGKLQVKFGIALMLQKYNFNLAPGKQENFRISSKLFGVSTTTTKKSFNFKVTSR